MRTRLLDGPPTTQWKEDCRAGACSPRPMRGCGAGSRLLRKLWGAKHEKSSRSSVERIPLMDAATLPMPATDVSLIALFWQAHWVVKAVMLGLLACSVWVWAIAIDKIFLYARTRRAMDRFEQAFWSGQSIEELYRALSAKPTQSMAACFVAAMREWKRSFESHSRS